MTQPTAYTRQFDFTDHSADHPDEQQPGNQLDAEFNAVLTTFSGILANLVLIQRDDGALRNGVVTLESMSSGALTALAGEWTPRGTWLTATAYAVSDVVVDGTKTVVCAVAHTSGTFATDLAAGKWVLLYDTAGATIADGSITTAKLAPGAVTDAKQSLTTLDLTGTFRAQGGVAAGTASPGGLMHAKADSGHVYVTAERATAAQGRVGVEMLGVGTNWYMRMDTSGTSLTFINNVLGTISTTLTQAGGLDQRGHIRTTASAPPSAGVGGMIYYSSSISYFDSYDFDAVAWKDLKVRGKDVYLTASAVDVVKVTSTTVAFTATGGVTRNTYQMGYLGAPLNTQSGAYPLALTDCGKRIYCTNVAGQTITIPANATVAFPVDDAVMVLINNGGGAVTVSPAVGVTLNWGASTGSRTLGVKGVATLMKVATNEWFVVGTEIT